MIVTFDLFSAMTNSRAGGSQTFAKLARSRGWEYTGRVLYDRWDAHNKVGQRTATAPTTFHDLSLRALRQTYVDFGLDISKANEDMVALEDSVSEWPLWPDIADAVREIAERSRVGLLSNVDDRLARRTRAFRLIEPELALTSQRLGAFKPNPEIYQAAVAAVAPEKLVHIAAQLATSAAPRSWHHHRAARATRPQSRRRRPEASPRGRRTPRICWSCSRGCD